MRRATQAQDGSNRTVIISIHALHEESDPSDCHVIAVGVTVFQSTLSMRRATGYYFYPMD